LPVQYVFRVVALHESPLDLHEVFRENHLVLPLVAVSEGVATPIDGSLENSQLLVVAPVLEELLFGRLVSIMQPPVVRSAGVADVGLFLPFLYVEVVGS